MTSGNGHSTSYSFLDRAALLFYRGPIAAALAHETVWQEGKATSLPLDTRIEALQADPALNLEVAQVLSPSQANAYLDCGAKWFFKYFRNLPDVTDAKRARGLAVHKAILEGNFRQKINSHKDLDRETILNVYEKAWKEEAAKATFAEADDKAEFERSGAILVQKYLIEGAPSIIPVLVEHPVSGVIGGVQVRGYVDLMDSNGCIIDLKCPAKKPSEISADYKRQVATYTQLTPGASGKTLVQNLIPTKTPQLYPQPYTIKEADIRHTQVIYPLVQEAMRSGLYTPNRKSMFCSRSGCPFWKACEAEYGGEVEE